MAGYACTWTVAAARTGCRMCRPNQPAFPNRTRNDRDTISTSSATATVVSRMIGQVAWPRGKFRRSQLARPHSLAEHGGLTAPPRAESALSLLP